MFRFWSAPRTSQIDPDPSKVVLLLKREHDFQKIMFFYEKTVSSENDTFYIKKELQKQLKNSIFERRKGTFGRYIWYRIIGIRPGPSLGPLLYRFRYTFGLYFGHIFGICSMFFWVKTFNLMGRIFLIFIFVSCIRALPARVTPVWQSNQTRQFVGLH